MPGDAVPGAEDPTLPDFLGPSPSTAPAATRTWTDASDRGPGVGADPTSIYPTAPPTAPPTPPPAPPPLPPVPTGRPGRNGGARGRARTAVGLVLVFLAGLSGASAVAAAWTRAQIRDEDTWAATSQALVTDPTVQEDVADALATQVITAVGVDDLIQGALPGPLGGLASPLTDQATGLVGDLALRLVRTDAFVAAWDAAVRASHEELLAALDDGGRFTTITSDGVALDLGSTLGEFRQLLHDQGLTFLDGVDVSGVDVQFLLIDAPGLQRVSDLLDVLDVLVVVLPIVAVGALVLGLAVARRRSWAVAAGGLGALVAVGLVWLLAEIGRRRAADELTGGILGPAAVDAVADHVTSSLAAAMALVAVVGLVAALAGSGVAVATTRRS